MDLCEQKVEAKKHRMEWCAAASKSCCMRYARSRDKLKMTGKCEGPRWLAGRSKHKLKIQGNGTWEEESNPNNCR